MQVTHICGQKKKDTTSHQCWKAIIRWKTAPIMSHRYKNIKGSPEGHPDKRMSYICRLNSHALSPSTHKSGVYTYLRKREDIYNFGCPMLLVYRKMPSSLFALSSLLSQHYSSASAPYLEENPAL